MSAPSPRLRRPYESHAAFYREVYAHALREVRPAGRTGAATLAAEQAAGDWSNAPCPDLVLSRLVRHRGAGSLDLGAGRFTGLYGPGAFIVIAPHVATTILMEGRHEVRAIGLPYANLLRLAGEGSDLPRDGDFGALHARMQSDRGVVWLMERLWAECRAGNPHGALGADGLLLQLAAALLRLRDGRSPVAVARGGMSPLALRRVKERIEARLGEDLDLAELAHACGFASSQHMATVFRRLLGTSPSAYRQALRA
jgi:AraC family transcriptional regulator